MDKQFWAATFTLTGTIIGAGILGLPYVFSQSGFLAGVFWLFALGLLMVFAKVYLAEITLRTKGSHQLAGYAEKYLGKAGKYAMVFAMVFGIYSAIIAYLIGEGQSLSQLFLGNTNYAILFAFLFWILMSNFLYEGLKGLKKIETWGVLIIVLIVIGIFIWFLPGVQVENLTYINTTSFFFPLGVALFALLGFTSIPEIRKELKGGEKKMKKVIIFGSILPIFLYILFTLIFVGTFGQGVSEVATLSFGKVVTILGIFTMMTSYFVLSFSLKDMFKEDLKFGKFPTFFFSILLPFLIYLLISWFGFFGFVAVLGIGGTIAGGLTGILVLFMNKKAKKIGDRKPEFSIPINWFVIVLISLIFIFGIVVQLFF